MIYYFDDPFGLMYYILYLFVKNKCQCFYCHCVKFSYLFTLFIMKIQGCFKIFFS